MLEQRSGCWWETWCEYLSQCQCFSVSTCFEPQTWQMCWIHTLKPRQIVTYLIITVLLRRSDITKFVWYLSVDLLFIQVVRAYSPKLQWFMCAHFFFFCFFLLAQHFIPTLETAHQPKTQAMTSLHGHKQQLVSKWRQLKHFSGSTWRGFKQLE